VLKRVMVVMLLGCVGLTAGVAFGTLFRSNVISTFTPVNTSCHSDLSHQHPSVTITRLQHPGARGNARLRAPDSGCPSYHGGLIYRGLPTGGYVLLGLLAGLSAALVFLVPPRSRVTPVH
jgi:hypothetical protein